MDENVKFKVGDRVKCIQPMDALNTEDIYTVVEAWDNSQWVRLSEHKGLQYRAVRFKKINETKTL